MPIYEYECLGNGHHFEVQQKMSDPPVTECPECKSAVKRLISRTSFHLKGGGWYAEGYGSSSKGTSTSAPATSPSEAPSSGSNETSKPKDSKGSSTPGSSTPAAS